MSSAPQFLVCALLLLVSACSSQRGRPPRPNVPVTVATVQRRSVTNEIGAIGSVTPIQSVAVRSQVGGILMSVGFDEGDDVTVGQVLFQIDERPYRATLDQARANLARDLAQLANARQQVARYEELSRGQLTSREQFDQMRANAEALTAAVAADSAAIESARLNLDYCTIRARISGRTGSLLVREGNLVRVNDANPLVIINQLRPIAVSFSVPQQSLNAIRRFSRERRLGVVIHPQDDSTTALSGRLSFINNQVDTTTGTIALKASFPNADSRLWPGEYVTVRLVLDVQEGVLTIPSQAVMVGQAGSFVYVVNADRSASTRPIVVGRAVNDDVVVDSGLAAGQLVVTDGQLRLSPGARVEVQEPGARAQQAAGGQGRGPGRGGAPRVDSGAARAGAPAATPEGRRGARP